MTIYSKIYREIFQTGIYHLVYIYIYIHYSKLDPLTNLEPVAEAASSKIPSHRTSLRWLQWTSQSAGELSKLVQ